MTNISKNNLNKLSDYLWEIPKSLNPKMKIPARIYSSESMLETLFQDQSLIQLINLTTLNGVYKYALALPDIHEGYGAPIGGVFASKIEEDGIISPGAIGFDINCGVRLLGSNLLESEIKEKIPKLTKEIYKEVPSGVGTGGYLNLSFNDLDKILENGIDFMLENGLANKQDKEFCESSGKLLADSKSVSQKAKKRGKGQLGTIGAGNHFVEIQKVAEIFDEQLAKELNLFKNQIVVMIHCGSRGLGHQVATDYISMMLKHLDDYQIKLIDQQLACAPFSSSLGQNYFKAMNASANFAWANRQLITIEIRKAWQNVFGKNQELSLVYDVAHNIGKIETYDNLKLLIHRKGATRSFSKGSLEIPQKYQNIGQPVLIPGSMGTSSYVLIGKEKAIQESFGSTCHGAGRIMSRTKAKKIIRGENLKKELNNKGIVVEAGSYSGLAEEAPSAYKNISEVIEVVIEGGLAQKVVKLIPLGVIKG